MSKLNPQLPLQDRHYRSFPRATRAHIGGLRRPRSNGEESGRHDSTQVIEQNNLATQAQQNPGVGAGPAYPLTPHPCKAGNRPKQSKCPILGDTAQSEHRRPQLWHPGPGSTEQTGKLRPAHRRGAQKCPAALPTPRQPGGRARPGLAPQRSRRPRPHPKLGPGVGGSGTCTSGGLARASGMAPASP